MNDFQDTLPKVLVDKDDDRWELCSDGLYECSTILGKSRNRRGSASFEYVRKHLGIKKVIR